MEMLLTIILVIVALALFVSVVIFTVAGFMTFKISNKIFKGMDEDKKW